MGLLLQGDSWMRLFCAVRTTEIDAQIQAALQQGSQPPIQQMVLLGESRVALLGRPGGGAWDTGAAAVGVGFDV